MKETELPVLRADPAFAVIAKPAGLMAHASAMARGEDDFLVDRLRAQFNRDVVLVHRLDRATSGCVLVAFDRDTAAALGAQFMERRVDKTYLAVCRGWPDAAGVIDHPLDGVDRLRHPERAAVGDASGRLVGVDAIDLDERVLEVV